MTVKKTVLLLCLFILSACGNPDRSNPPVTPPPPGTENNDIQPEQLVTVESSGNAKGILPDTITLIKNTFTLDNQILNFSQDQSNEDLERATLQFLNGDTFEMPFHQTFITFLQPVVLRKTYQIEGYNIGELINISNTQTESPEPGHFILFPATDEKFNASPNSNTPELRNLNGTITIDKQNNPDETFTLSFNNLGKTPSSINPSGTLNLDYSSDDLSVTLNITFNQTSTTIITLASTSQTFEYNTQSHAITETTEEEAQEPIVAD